MNNIGIFKGIDPEEDIEHNTNISGGATTADKSIKPNLTIALNKFHNSTNLEKDVIEMLKKMGIEKIGLPALFVVDEAKGLRYKKLGKDEEKYLWVFRDKNLKTLMFVDIFERAPYNIFRRAFRMFSVPWEFLILIIISTSGQISVLLPELGIDPSRRETTSLKFIDNFTLVQTYNVNAKSAASIHAGMFPREKINNWNEFLESNFRKEEFFKFGRPLIYGTFVNKIGKKLYTNEYDLDATLDDCKEFKLS